MEKVIVSSMKVIVPSMDNYEVLESLKGKDEIPFASL